MGRFICITSIPELDAEEFPELLSEVSELEEVSMEYLILFFLLLFLETSSFNLLGVGGTGGCEIFCDISFSAYYLGT